MNREFWTELLASWLKSIGAKDFIEGHFYYKKREYVTYFGFSYCRIVDYALGYDPGVGWIGFNIEIEDVDICDPSFDPHIFFTPFKEWMDNHE